MSSLTSREWLSVLAELGAADLRRISRLVDLLVTAKPASKATANVMLDAVPKPDTAQDARDRTDSIIRYLAAAE